QHVAWYRHGYRDRHAGRHHLGLWRARLGAGRPHQILVRRADAHDRDRRAGTAFRRRNRRDRTRRPRPDPMGTAPHFRTQRQTMSLSSPPLRDGFTERDPDALFFVPLGGSGEIGMNLNVYGYGGRWLLVA